MTIKVGEKLSNLTKRYYNTDNKKYMFQIEEIENRGIAVAIIQWSNFKRIHIFDCYLSSIAYLDLLNDVEVQAESLFEDMVNDSRYIEPGILELLIAKKIKYNFGNSNYIDIAKRVIFFENREEAQKCITLLEKRFINITL